MSYHNCGKKDHIARNLWVEGGGVHGGNDGGEEANNCAADFPSMDEQVICQPLCRNEPRERTLLDRTNVN